MPSASTWPITEKTMGLERAGGVGGDGLGVSGVATLQDDLNSPAGANVTGTGLFVKNMPTLRICFIPVLGNGASIAIQIGIRGGNAIGIVDFQTVETIIVGPGPGAPVWWERRFPADFLRVVVTPAAAVNTTIRTLIGSGV